MRIVGVSIAGFSVLLSLAVFLPRVLMVAVMGGIVGGFLMARGATTIEDDIAQVAEESAGDPLAAFL